jgi:FkbM family methyltransferase
VKTFSQLKLLNVGPLNFAVRQGTSDFKAIKEVVIDKGYQRRDFAPQPGETWIDVGANCGAFAVWAGSLGATVIAFEPDPENASIARTNIEANKLGKLVTLRESGLTADEGEGEAALHRNTAKGNLWRNSLFKKWQGGETIKVPTEPIAPYWSQDYCIKLDAEGVEMPILEKYSEQKVRKLVFEWSFDIDPSLARFENIIAKLRGIYRHVSFAGYKSGYTRWQSSWFPACRTVWCYDNP